jgi:hypothetical protein
VTAFAQRALSSVASMAVGRRADLVVGGSPIGQGEEDGCLIRLAGVYFEEVAAAARAFLDFLPARLGDDPWARKW